MGKQAEIVEGSWLLFHVCRSHLISGLQAAIARPFILTMRSQLLCLQNSWNSRQSHPTNCFNSFGTHHVSVFDVNSLQSRQKAHVSGALNIDPMDFKASDRPVDKTSRLVFYCSNYFCRKAPNAARRAKSIGYSDVQVMSAGIRG